MKYLYRLLKRIFPILKFHENTMISQQIFCASYEKSIFRNCSEQTRQIKKTPHMADKPIRHIRCSIVILHNYIIRYSSRNTCSTASSIFFPAFSGTIASSRVVTPRTMGKNASIPSSLHFPASSVTPPANAMTLF